jgi:hypothetical protein
LFVMMTASGLAGFLKVRVLFVYTFFGEHQSVAAGPPRASKLTCCLLLHVLLLLLRDDALTGRHALRGVNSYYRQRFRAGESFGRRLRTSS